jgi:hypothetical protein
MAKSGVERHRKIIYRIFFNIFTSQNNIHQKYEIASKNRERKNFSLFR